MKLSPLNSNFKQEKKPFEFLRRKKLKIVPQVSASSIELSQELWSALHLRLLDESSASVLSPPLTSSAAFTPIDNLTRYASLAVPYTPQINTTQLYLESHDETDCEPSYAHHSPGKEMHSYLDRLRVLKLKRKAQELREVDPGKAVEVLQEAISVQLKGGELFEKIPIDATSLFSPDKMTFILLESNVALAVLKVQRFYKRHFARRLSAASKLIFWFRRYIGGRIRIQPKNEHIESISPLEGRHRCQLQLFHNCAVVIQRLLRHRRIISKRTIESPCGYNYATKKRRNRQNVMRIEEPNISYEIPTRCIQRCFRRYLKQRRSSKVELLLKHDLEATLKIQSAIRQHLAQQRLSYLKMKA